MKDTSQGVEMSFAVSLMENLVTPTFVVNVDGFVVIWNKACERLTGLKSKEVIGTKNHWKGFYDYQRPCLVDMVISKHRNNAYQHQTLHEHYSHIDIDDNSLKAENWCVMPLLGKKKYVAIDAGPIYDGAGNLIAAVETLRDLTELKQVQSNLEKLTNVDSLTRIGNRRYFDLQLEAHWLSSCRHHQPLGFMMIDVDYFKKYNDFYGHPQGDECLRNVAQAINSCISRSLDMAFRYGGEEFCVLLPDTDLPGTVYVAEKIISAIEQFGLEHKQSPISDKVTVSIGCYACKPSRELDPSTLIKAADEALYTAKSSGRARYVSAK